jgi:SAM-dependent methyltransferase
VSHPNERIVVWDDRYGRGEGFHDFRPSSPLPLAVGLASPGLALDLASGAGRHALYLAEHGWRVVAVEGSRVGIDVMVAEARRRGVAGAIDARAADLESHPRGFVLETDRYDLICDFYFLDRSLFDEIRDGVKPGGLFVASIHIEDQAARDRRNTRFLLAPGELRALVDGWGWEILHSVEGATLEAGHHHASAEIVARRPGRYSGARSRGS